MQLRVTDKRNPRAMLVHADQLHKVFAQWSIPINFMHYGLLVACLDNKDWCSVADILSEYELTIEVVDLLNTSEFESELSDTDIPKILKLFA